MMKKTITILFVSILALFIAGCQDSDSLPEIKISSYEECLGVGSPINGTDPLQCQSANGTIFTQDLPVWKTDGLTLRRIPETGTLACFGCGATQCIDPLPTLQQVEETEEQHCLDSFEVTGLTGNNGLNSGMPVPTEEPVEETIVGSQMPIISNDSGVEMIVEN